MDGAESGGSAGKAKGTPQVSMIVPNVVKGNIADQRHPIFSKLPEVAHGYIEILRHWQRR